MSRCLVIYIDIYIYRYIYSEMLQYYREKKLGMFNMFNRKGKKNNNKNKEHHHQQQQQTKTF